jgi:hypothetical protein
MYCSFVGEQYSSVRKEGNTSIFSDDEDYDSEETISDESLG